VTAALPWVALIVLGAYHGVNPAMGWLFAVALGLQRKSRQAVFSALLPIAIGHEGAVALAVALVSGARLLVSTDILRVVGAVALVCFGIFKLLLPMKSHPRWVGMNLTKTDLVVWSFLTSTAHGAGLMLLPILLGLPPLTGGSGNDVIEAGLSMSSLGLDILAVLVHTASMLLVMGTVAIIIYDRLGLRILRQAWVNLDLIWACAVIFAGVVTFFS
jgi:hypothetical protein